MLQDKIVNLIAHWDWENKTVDQCASAIIALFSTCKEPCCSMQGKHFLKFRSPYESLTIAEVLRKYEMLQKCPHVKDPFKWMERWLKAYEAKHPETSAKDIMGWINEQPTTDGG